MIHGVLKFGPAQAPSQSQWISSVGNFKRSWRSTFSGKAFDTRFTVLEATSRISLILV